MGIPRYAVRVSGHWESGVLAPAEDRLTVHVLCILSTRSAHSVYRVELL